jgi:hypothetical protein
VRDTGCWPEAGVYAPSIPTATIIALDSFIRVLSSPP